MLCSRFFGLFPWHPSCGNVPTPGRHSSRSLGTMDQAKPRVLVVDDDPHTRSLLSIALQSQAFEVIPAEDAGAALEQVRSEAPEIVILDLRLPGLDGMEALRKLKEIAPELPVVILTGYGDVPSAVEAMRLGAYDFLTKPVEPAKILVVVRRALKHQALGTELKELRRLGQRDALRWLMGRGQEIQQVIQQIKQVADSNFTILIQGETGTGKELVARSIHQLSARREKPFVALDCGAIPENLLESELFGYEKGAFTGADRRRIGKFEQCDGGTILLDEIGDMPILLQAKLLRLLQEKTFERVGGNESIRVNVRVVASTHRDLKAAADRFRADLYYRLSAFTIHLPPLRDRLEDLPALVQHFLSVFSPEMGRDVREIAPDALERLQAYSWPGNIRELQNVLRQALLRATGTVLLSSFLPDVSAGS